jgi:hypothetical protein
VALVTKTFDNNMFYQIEALPYQIIVLETKKKWQNNDVGRIID